MTYKDLLEKLNALDEDQLDQDVEVVGECIRDEYYDVDVRLDDDGYAVQVLLS